MGHDLDAGRGAVGVLHPGEMGASVAGALVVRGVRVLWASEGRSEQTRRRAAAAGLEDAGDLERLAASTEVILSICPPDAALEVARSVAAAGFTGLYVDANAVAPGTARTIQAIVEERGARFVDGDLIGGPARPGGSTRLYLSGPERAGVAELFAVSDRLEAVSLDADITAASALKMCYAAWTKGTAALLLAIRAVARTSGVEEPLLEEWQRSQPDLAQRTEAARRLAPRAWRFAGEMEEISQTFVDAGIAGAGFHAAASEVFRALAGFKDAEVGLDELLGTLTGRGRSEVTSALFAACDLALGVVRSPLVAEGWNLNSALEGLTVGALAAHLYSAIRRLESALEQPEPAHPRVVGDVPSFYGLNRIGHRDDLQDSFQVAIREEAAKRAEQGPAAITEKFEALVGRLESRLAGESMSRLVPVLRIEGGAARLSDYLATRVVELVVHADDLAASVGLEIGLPDEAASAVFTVFLELARARSGDMAVLRAFARRERADAEVLRVL